jgi:putative transposase
VVDTLGLILVVVVHAASLQDRDGATVVLQLLVRGWSRLQLIWADGGYAGQLVEWVKALGRRWRLEIVKRSDDMVGFKILPKRWIVERTFGWLGRYRRHSKDYEALTESSESMIRISMINLMLHRLKPG